MKILIACFVIFTSITAFAGNEPEIGEVDTDSCTKVNDGHVDGTVSGTVQGSGNKGNETGEDK